MKKQITAIAAITLTAALLAGCSGKPTVTPGGVNYTNSNKDSDNLSNTTESTTESAESTTESTESIPIVPEPIERERFVYGEKEIPDLAFESGEYIKGTHLKARPDGRMDLNGHGNPHYDNRLLDSMVFETHTFGDYTINLVGDYVRTDKEHFPGRIFMQNLHIEVEKNGVKLPAEHGDWFGMGYQYPEMYAVGDYHGEEMLCEDQIGSYIDVYGLKNPVIAMRYIYGYDYNESVQKAVSFARIENDQIVGEYFRDFAENTGVFISGGPELSKGGFYAVYSEDKFKVENENTLIDETAGIRYIFDFDSADDVENHSFTEKIG